MRRKCPGLKFSTEAMAEYDITRIFKKAKALGHFTKSNHEKKIKAFGQMH
jgi:hypothetical protein